PLFDERRGLLSGPGLPAGGRRGMRAVGIALGLGHDFPPTGACSRLAVRLALPQRHSSRLGPCARVFQPARQRTAHGACMEPRPSSSPASPPAHAPSRTRPGSNAPRNSPRHLLRNSVRRRRSAPPPPSL